MRRSFYIKLLVISLLPGYITPSLGQTTLVSFDDTHITYEGRIGKKETTSEIYWSGSSIHINFEGTAIKATLEDENGTNYFNIIIDGQVAVLKLKKGRQSYTLAEHLDSGKHSLLLTKRNEWTYGMTSFYGFEIDDYKALPPPKKKSVFIEFYGDSITTGHGNEDTSGNDKPDGSVTNNYNTYAAMTARSFHADYTCIARGGIGVMVSWYDMIMPEMYNRLNPKDPKSIWDFSQKIPDIVVINLFQNDSWIVNKPDNPEFKRRFGTKKPTKNFIITSYQSFIKKIRKQYPKASIICLLGNMDSTKDDSEWPEYVDTAVRSMQDDHIYTCIVPFKKTKGHPNVEEHKVIAEKLSEIIKTKIQL
ncbi:SGNH/GDSL hydrolase family protein [Aquimarina sp. RZ0]|uniref:SGNH/GDSL hydrolase family protein n=1 Tax=Aquimarina sp. RZ0 TaxID=2607730 RepID=UPI0011F1F86E|nr:SGNH/GDSL hydrolase family protein [Aquimarina sp. RZ0]KAA1244784.1 SGNH/GDSL hydrolase family protein [Aquimarina sp. RZ0]